MADSSAYEHEPSEKRGQTRSSALPMYRIAYEESKRALDDQIAEIDGMRQRAAQFLAFIGTASAFLVGTGLNTATRDSGFYALASLGTGLSLIALALACAVLLGVSGIRPGKRIRTWVLRLSALDLIRWIEPEIHAPDETDFVKEIARLNGRMVELNAPGLMGLRRMYLAFLTSGFLQLVVWSVLVWSKG